jgi:hypothetical protein
MASQALSQDAIQALLATARGRGDYDTVLSDFLKSDDAGIEVDLTSGALAGKDAKNVVTGLNNAKTRMNKETGLPVHQGGHAVKVILRKVGEGDAAEEHVFLINTTKVGGGDQTAEAAETTEAAA